MAIEKPNRDGGALSDLAATPVLVRDPQAFRDMLWGRLRVCAKGLAEMTSSQDVLLGRPLQSSERCAKGYLAELNQCAELLEQVGWYQRAKRRA